MKKTSRLFLPTYGAAIAAPLCFSTEYDCPRRTLIEGVHVSFAMLSGAPAAGFLAYVKSMVLGYAGKATNAGLQAADAWNPSEAAVGAIPSYNAYVPKLTGELFLLSYVKGAVENPLFVPCRYIIEPGNQFTLETTFGLDNTDTPTSLSWMIQPVGRYLDDPGATNQNWRAV